MEQMKIFRAQIDSLDSEIIELFAKRFEIVRNVGKYKKENEIQPLQSRRWQEILDKISIQAETSGLEKEFIFSVWNDIHEYALRIESSIINS